MSNLSSDTLFHFTSWNNLISILAKGFQPKFSLERFCFQKGKSSEIAVPMVSFCDIPLSQIVFHVKRYGSYGLGLSKEWGIAKGLNPVLYLKENSSLSVNVRASLVTLEFVDPLLRKAKQDLQSIDKKINELGKKLSGNKLKIATKKLHESLMKDVTKMEQAVYSAMSILQHTKQYEGYSLRKGEKKAKVRFYDEREWRYVPPIPKVLVLSSGKIDISGGILEKEQFADADIRSQANALIEPTKLHFNPSVIRYIIVKKDREVLTMINELERIKGNKYPANAIKILTSRILTYDQIEKDF
jgi:hypothetical protein